MLLCQGRNALEIQGPVADIVTTKITWPIGSVTP